MEAKGEQLLQDLVNQEKTIVGKVDGAREQAAKLVQDAYAEAASLKAKATEKAEALFKDMMGKANAEAETARGDILGKAKAEVGMTENLAKANMDKAVKLVLERVMP